MTTIRTLQLSDLDQMLEIFLAHDKFQRLPKMAVKSTVADPSVNIDSYIENLWYEDLQRNLSTWFGSFNSSNIMTGFIRCRIWQSSRGKNNCTIGISVKNKNVVHNYTYGQSFFPDDIIDLYNHCVLVAENNNCEAIYHTRNAAFSDDSPKRWIPVNEMNACLLSTYNAEELTVLRPNTVPVYSDNMITNQEFIYNVFGIYLSTAQKTFRFTKP